MFKEELKEMFETFRVVEPKTFNLYYKKLKNSGLDEEVITERIKKLCLIFKPEYGKKMPSLSEIIGIDVASKDTADVEIAWQEFKRVCCNNYKFESMPDWVFTIKRLIGSHEVEEMTGETEKWVKKEFLRIFPAVKTGTIPLEKENVSYITDGKVVLLEQDAGLFEPGVFLKSKERLLLK
jgi:hypothetical protein